MSDMKTAFLPYRPTPDNYELIESTLRRFYDIGIREVVLTGFAGGRAHEGYIAAMKRAIEICHEIGLHYRLEWCKPSKNPMCYDSESHLMGAVTLRKCKGFAPRFISRNFRQLTYHCEAPALYVMEIESDIAVTLRWRPLAWTKAKFVDAEIVPGRNTLVLPALGMTKWTLETVQDVPINYIRVLSFVETAPPDGTKIIGVKPNGKPIYEKSEIRARTPGVQGMIEWAYDKLYGEVQWLGTNTPYMAQMTQPRWTSAFVRQIFAEHAYWLVDTFNLKTDPYFTGFFAHNDEGHTFHQSREERRRWPNLCAERADIATFIAETGFAATGKPVAMFGDGLGGHNDLSIEIGNYANDVTDCAGMTTPFYLSDETCSKIEIWDWAPEQIQHLSSIDNHIFFRETAGFHSVRQVAAFNWREPAGSCDLRNALWPNADCAYVEEEYSVEAFERWARA